MWRTGEEGCRDTDDRLRLLFILVAVVNAGGDDDGVNRHTGDMGRLPLKHSIERGLRLRSRPVRVFARTM